jgi:hypothetical protein|tara:strand:- start:106 stop:627 length:522 start_codon:yes stop_codon:yes gene_type:complete
MSLNVIKRTRRMAVVSIASTDTNANTYWANVGGAGVGNILYLAANGSPFQTIDQPNAQCFINDIVYSIAPFQVKRADERLNASPTITITRHHATHDPDHTDDSNVILVLSGEEDISFSQQYGYVVGEHSGIPGGAANANIKITFNGVGYINLTLSKSIGYVDPNRQNLLDRQK